MDCTTREGNTCGREHTVEWVGGCWRKEKEEEQEWLIDSSIIKRHDDSMTLTAAATGICQPADPQALIKDTTSVSPG